MPANIHDIPESVRLSWGSPNLVDPIRRTWMPAYCIVWQLASTAVLAGRLFLRAKKQAGSFGLDDVFISVGWVFSIGLTATAWLAAERYGADRHPWDVPEGLWVGSALTAWIAQVMFVFSTVPTKLSVLLLYRRLVSDALEHRWLYAIYLVLFLTAAGGFGIFLTFCVICMPLDAYWKSYDLSYTQSFTCIDGNALIIVSCVLSSLSNIYTVAIPLAIVRHYSPNISRGQMISLHVMFGMGLLVTGAGIGRTYYMWRGNHTYDTTWAGFNLAVWALAECHLTIICACAPSLRIFFLLYVRSPFRRSVMKASANASARRTATREASIIEPNEKSDEWENRDHSVVRNGKLGVLPDTSEVAVVDASSNTLSNTGFSETGRVTTPEEYEMYAMAQLRAASPRSMLRD